MRQIISADAKYFHGKLTLVFIDKNTDLNRTGFISYSDNKQAGVLVRRTNK
jgi:hypothetical protein